jgi:hypothetical protein
MNPATLRLLRLLTAAALCTASCGGPSSGGSPGTGGDSTPGTGGAGPPATGGKLGTNTGGSPGTGGATPGPGAGGGGGTGGGGATDAASQPPRDAAPAADRAADSAPAPAPADAAPAGNLAELDRACTPKVTLMLMDTGPKGQIFLEAMGGSPDGVQKTVQQIGRDVCRVLYRRADEVRAANEMELIIRDYDGVAGKWGDLGKIGVEISTQHLQNVKNMGRDVGREIKGILFHEMTHMYQHDDKPEGTWPGLANYYEAGADAVRIRNGYVPDGCRPGKNGTWSQHNYCTGGYWWLWVDTKIPDFLYKLNIQMKGRDGKAWMPADATAIGGVSLDDLWTEYKTAACCNGTNTTCCK